jgi:putative effector of murein hydrolase
MMSRWLKSSGPRALQTHPGSVAFAALAMGQKGVCTALVMALLVRWL